jgi:hypothetical protein
VVGEGLPRSTGQRQQGLPTRLAGRFGLRWPAGVALGLAAGACWAVTTAAIRLLAENWLRQHLAVPFDGPFHRPDDDLRPDVQVKADIHRYLARHYDIVGAVDDNPNVIALWDRQLFVRQNE